MKLAHSLVALSTGIVFAVGLAIGGMTLPSKVIGFFDFSSGLSSWDPSLAFVLGGALFVYAPLYRFATRNARPLFAMSFQLPTRKDLDPRLVGGAALFGVGWGLGGFCPGPALASVGAFSGQAAIFSGAMLVGMLLFQRIDRWLTSRAVAAAAADPERGAQAEVTDPFAGVDA